jgi:hypothetical protein
MKAFKLDPATLTSIEDIALVLDGLGLVMRDDAPMYDALGKYFSIEVETPGAIAGETVDATIAQEEG